MRFILALSFLAAITGLAAAAETYYPQQVEYQQPYGQRRPNATGLLLIRPPAGLMLSETATCIGGCDIPSHFCRGR